MALPGFTDVGDLPSGIHRAALAEVMEGFGTGSLQRRLLAARLERIYSIALDTGHLLRFVVFGSFVTAKPEPNDVDVFMIMGDGFEFRRVTGEARLLFEHASAQSYFGCSVFWIRRVAAMGGEQSALEDWQVKRDGTRRGIIEIVGERT